MSLRGMGFFRVGEHWLNDAPAFGGGWRSRFQGRFATGSSEAGIVYRWKCSPQKTKGSAFAIPLGFLIEEPVISSWLSSLLFS